MSAAVYNDSVKGLGPCAGCGHDPACGWAQVGDDWLCHTDDHSCYVGCTLIASNPAIGFVWFSPETLAWLDAWRYETSPNRTLPLAAAPSAVDQGEPTQP